MSTNLTPRKPVGMKQELFIVAISWGVGAGVGQLAVMPFGLANWPLWFGLCLGATSQSAIYFFRRSNSK